MSLRRLLLTAAAATLIAGPASAQIFFNVGINTPPPAPRYEPIPVARPGYVWAPGYWDWNHDQYRWVGGSWRADRPGYRWVPDRWNHYDNRWDRSSGHWARIENHDHDWDRHDNGRHNGWRR